MGAWGTGPFDNDGALDWMIELEDLDDWAIVRAKIVEAADEAAWVDAHVAAEALAAAEVIAAGRGRPRRTLPAQVEGFLDRVDGVPSDEDARWAAGVVERILGEGSELAQLWDEADPAWRIDTQDLVARLRW